MGNFFRNLLYKYQRFMQGRYGVDTLSRHLNIAALVLVILSFFVRLLYIPALALMIWATVRTYSKNLPARQREGAAYARFTTKLRKRFKLIKNRWRDRKTHRFFKCPGCKEYLRVPKGRGEVHITCPGCRHMIVRKT